MIDIVVMTKDDDKFLASCVESIINTVSLDYRIFIVDNASTTTSHLDTLTLLEQNTDIVICRNKLNFWVLGLNQLLTKLRSENLSNYFVLTDADIIFPKQVQDSKCWLEYLVRRMEQNYCIGKLGLSLDWSILEENSELNYILDQEKSLYNPDKMITDLFISPVDTTAAIYRWDWSIASGCKFYPLHMTYLRAELYSCRTPRTILANHIGWELYRNKYKSSTEFDLALINSKVLCFSIVAGDVKNTTLQQASLLYRVLYYLIKTPMKVYWSIKRIYHGIIYHVVNYLRKYDNT